MVHEAGLLSSPVVLCKNEVLSLSADDLGSHFLQKRFLCICLSFSLGLLVIFLIYYLISYLYVTKPFARESYHNYTHCFACFYLSQTLPDLPVSWITGFLLFEIHIPVQRGFK